MKMARYKKHKKKSLMDDLVTDLTTKKAEVPQKELGNAVETAAAV